MMNNNLTSVVDAGDYPVYSGRNALSELAGLFKRNEFGANKYFILVDENSLKFCFQGLLANVGSLANAEVIEISSGEENKTIEVCSGIWEVLSNLGADRHSMLINLGGGVITDMGGFIAGTFKRGIRFINIPTTLLSQVDASIGGKVGVDLNHLKNEVGLFNSPDAVIIDPSFLNTLPRNQLMSGFAEIIKHALICDADYWEKVKNTTFYELESLDELIHHSLRLKNAVVLEDPYETGRRKILNFGHTIGHAIESFSLESSGKSLLHGEAVALGMICESYISYKLKMLSESNLYDITSFIMKHYKKTEFDNMYFHRLIELMRHDKKNRNGKMYFSLLNGIGNCKTDVEINADLVIDSLNYYTRWVAQPV